MATIVRYVNTDTTAGGTGLTPSKYGPDRAYATQSAAETALRQSLIAITNDYDKPRTALQLRCAGVTADPTVVTYTNASWVTDAYHRIEVIGESTQARWDATKYRMVAANGIYGAGVITVGKALHCTFRGLQIENTALLDQHPACVLQSNFASDIEILGGFYRITSELGTVDQPVCVRWISTGAARMVIQGLTGVVTIGSGFDAEDNNDNVGASMIMTNCTFVQRGTRNITNRALLQTGGLDSGGAGAGMHRFRNVVLQSSSQNWYLGGVYDQIGPIVTLDGTSPTVALRNTRVRFVDPDNWDYRLHPDNPTLFGCGVDVRNDPYWVP